MFHWLLDDTKINLEAYKTAELRGKNLKVPPLPRSPLLLPIQLQGENNVTDLTFKTEWLEKLETFLSKHGTVNH